MKPPFVRILRLPWLPALVLLYSMPFVTLLGFSMIGFGVRQLADPSRGSTPFESLLGESFLRGTLYFCVAIVLPFGFGLATARAFQEFFHCPFSLLLPSARRRMVGGHLGLTVAMAATTALVGRFLWGGMPWLASFGVALAGASLWVPLDQGRRWQGSYLAFLGLGALIACGGFNSGHLLDLLAGHEFIAAGAGLGVAAVCFGLGYSRERLRRRALTPLTTLFGALGDGAAWARWQSNRARAKWGASREGADLGAPPSGGSTWSWVRLIFHEAYGQARAGKRMVLLLPVLVLPIFLLMGFLIMKLFPEFVAPGLGHGMSTARHLAHQRHNDLSFMPGVLVLVVAAIWSSRWPKLDAPFPLSRRQRFRVVAAWSLAMELWVLVAVMGGILVEGGGERLAGADHVAWRLRMGTALLLGLLMSAFSLGAAFYRSRGRMPLAFTLYGLAWLVPGVGISILAEFSGGILSLGGLLVGAAVVTLLHAAYFQRVRSVCLNGDLVFRAY